MTVFGHIAGVPVEETLVQFVPVGVVALIAVRVTRERARRWAGRLRSAAPAKRQQIE